MSDIIVYTTEKTIACTGELNDHPMVWYTVPEQGYVVCGYCDIKFARKQEEE